MINNKYFITSSNKRNYQLDFLKLIFAFIVFLTHGFSIVKNTEAEFPLSFGEVPVHFFFIVSGMLMINSINKNSIYNSSNRPCIINQSCGKAAFNFIINKFKIIALQYWTSLIIFMVVFIYLKDKSLFESIGLFLKVFPSAFAVTNSGIMIEYNPPLWYISSMLLCMLPFTYMIYKNKDFFIYVFSPLCAVFTLGFMCQINNYAIVDRVVLFGVIIGGIIRGLCGLSFGVVSWIIYNKINELIKTKSQRILITFVEALLWLMFFGGWFCYRDKQILISLLLILPITVGITFSQKSYINCLFKFRAFKYTGSLSLALYLNHWAARVTVQTLYAGYDYKKSFFIMSAYTVIYCIIYYTLISLIKYIYKNRLKMNPPLSSRQSK